MPTVTEQQALQAIEFSKRTEDPEMKQRLGALVNGYKQQQESQGLDLFPKFHRKQADDQRRVRSMFTDRERHGLDDDQFHDLSQTFVGDEESKFGFLNDQFLSRQFRRSTDDIRPIRPQYRDEYASATWGAPVATETEFFDRVADDYDAEDLLNDYAQNAALRGLTSLEAYSKMPDELRDNAAFQRREFDFRRNYETTLQNTADRVSPYQQLIAGAVESLQIKTGVKGGEADDSYADLTQALINVPERDRTLVLSAIIANGGDGEIKGAAQKLAENFGRGTVGLGLGAMSNTSRRGMVSATQRVNTLSSLPVGDDLLTYAIEQESLSFDASGGGIAAASMVRVKTRKVTNEERREALIKADKILDAIDLNNSLRRIAEENIDPAKGEYLVTNGIYQAVRSLPYMAAALAGPAGFAVTSEALANDSYERLRETNPDMTREQASALATVSGPFQASVERLSGRLLTGKLPAFERFFNKAVVTSGAKLARFGARTTSLTLLEMVQENVQDITPFVAQGVISTLSEDLPETPWADVFGDMANNQTELFFAVFPLTLIGAGAGTYRDIKGARDLLSDYDMLRASGMSESAASEIRRKTIKGDLDGAQSMLREEFSNVAADTKDISDFRAELSHKSQTEKIRRLEAVDDAVKIGSLPAIRREAEGYTLRFEDGSASPVFDNFQDADEARWDHAKEQRLNLHAATRNVISQVDSQIESGREVKYVFDPQQKTLEQAVEEGVVSQEAAENRANIANEQQVQGKTDQPKVEDIASEFKAALASANLEANTDEGRLAASVILGSNVNKFQEGVQKTTIRLYQDASPLTVIEEKTEGDATVMIENGKREWLVDALREYESVAGDSLFLEEKSDEDLTDGDIKEAWSHLAQSYFVGRSRKGDVGDKWGSKQFRNQAAKIMSTKVGGALSAYGEFFRSVWKRAARLNRLRREGALDEDLEKELARSVGLTEQNEHESGVAKKAESLLSDLAKRVADSNSNSKEEESFSIILKDEQGEAGSGAGRPESFVREVASDLQISVESLFEERTDDRRDRERDSIVGTISRSGGTEIVSEWEKYSGDFAIYGGEHHAELSRDGKRMEKWTGIFRVYDDFEPSMPFGAAMWVGQDGKPQPGRLEEATPFEYLVRQAWHNYLFDDDTRIEEITEQGYYHISQPLLDPQYDIEFDPSLDKSNNLSEAAITLWLSGKGWDLYDSGAIFSEHIFIHKETGVLATDIKADNFGRREDGSLTPIDFILMPTEDLLPPMVTESKSETSFSTIVKPDDRIAAMFSPFQRSPEMRIILASEMKRRGVEVATKWAPIIAARRTKKEINISQKEIEKDFLEQKLEDNNLSGTEGMTAVSATKLKELEKEAKNEAKVWAESAQKQRDTTGSDRNNLLGALRTLDAIISALPPEVRGKIGGFVKLATLNTPEAMLKEIEKRTTAMDRELERYLSKQADEGVKKLFKKVENSRQRQAGKVAKGRNLPEIYELFDTLKKAYKSFSSEQGRKEADSLQAQLDEGSIIEDRIAVTELAIELIPLFAGWNGRTEDQTVDGETIRVRVSSAAGSAQRTAALNQADYIWKDGYSNWKISRAETKERRDAIREQGVSDIANASKLRTKDEQKLVDGSRFGLPRQLNFGLMSFDGFLRWMMGEDSTVYQMLSDGERDASNTYTDAVAGISQGVEDLMTRLAGGRLAGRKLEYRLSQPSEEFSNPYGEPRNMSQLEMVSVLLMWRQEDGRRHMEGRFDDDGSLISDWSYDEDFVSEVEDRMSAEAWEVFTYLADAYAGEYDSLNATYRNLFGVDLPRHAFYAPLTVQPENQNDTGVDPLTHFFSGGLSGVSGSFKTRGNSTVEPDFRNALKTFISHSMQMEHFKAYGEFSREARAMVNRKSFKDQIFRAGGQEAVNVLSGWMELIDQGGVRDAGRNMAMSKALERLGGRLAQTILFGKIQTILLNATQLGGAAVDMPAGKYLIQMSKLMAGRLDWFQALNTPYIKRRIDEMPPVVRQALESGSKGMPNRLQDISERIGFGISLSDGFFTAGTYVMVLDHQMRIGSRMGMQGETLEAWARTETERIVDRVAQPTRKGARSPKENNSSPEARILWNFGSEARKTTALMIYATAKGSSQNRLGTAAYTLLFSALMSQLLRTAWRDARDDDDDEIFDKDNWSLSGIAIHGAIDPLYGIPIFGPMAQDFLLELAGERTFDGSVLDVGKRSVPAGKRLATLDYDSDEYDLLISDINKIFQAGAVGSKTSAALAAITNGLKDGAQLLKNLAK